MLSESESFQMREVREDVGEAIYQPGDETTNPRRELHLHRLSEPEPINFNPPPFHPLAHTLGVQGTAVIPQELRSDLHFLFCARLDNRKRLHLDGSIPALSSSDSIFWYIRSRKPIYILKALTKNA